MAAPTAILGNRVPTLSIADLVARSTLRAGLWELLTTLRAQNPEVQLEARPPSRTASAPEALHVLRQRARQGAPARDRPRWETEAPACLVRGGGGKNEESWDDERREIGKGLLRGERAKTDVRGGGDRDGARATDR
ncbi:hypothetical protein HPB47_002813 [Ixodes persulcatus]|uniref:Uncharacterized protein n=1 Tax=Ixodes persulcatus TaxID=34615 RepID=A0AC60PK71_IXOPE|nr:hypothetical protein HPB47_002813 [Ixodes persulcatus]